MNDYIVALLQQRLADVEDSPEGREDELVLINDALKAFILPKEDLKVVLAALKFSTDVYEDLSRDGMAKQMERQLAYLKEKVVIGRIEKALEQN